MYHYCRLLFFCFFMNRFLYSFINAPLQYMVKTYPRLLSSLNANKETQYIRTVKDHNTFSEAELDIFLDENPFIRDKKLISISPGGFKGFYVLGVCKFIKQHYNLDDYIFSGASAGAWNSLLLCFKRDIGEIQNKILDTTLQNTHKLLDIEKRIQHKMLDEFTTADFDLKRLFIGVTTFQNCKTNTTIYTGFDSLEDALDCCIASSHIPMVTGGLTNFYRNVLSFDGGFSKYPYLNTTKSVLHITPNIWRKGERIENQQKSLSIHDYTTLFSKAQFQFSDTVEKGYRDSVENRKVLDSIFDIKNST